MKYVFSIIFLYFLIISKSTADDIIQFPDSVFKQLLLEQEYFFQPLIDLNHDGEIQYSEAEAYTEPLSINYGERGIKDLTGIKAFVNLKYLTIDGNTSLESIDLSGMKNLVHIQIERNKILKYLNLSDCVHLGLIHALYNALTDIKINNCMNLKTLKIQDNKLDSLDFRTAEQIQNISCSRNNLIKIELDGCKSLNSLGIRNNRISHFNFSMFSNLEVLYANNNKLRALELNNTTSLNTLVVDSNNLGSLNIRNGNNQIITTFSTLGNPNLKCITVDNAEYSYHNWKNIDTWNDFSEDCTISVKENNVPNFRIYPNPADNVLTIKWENNLEEDLRIIDISGKIYLSHTIYTGMNELHLDISRLPKGKYVVEIGEQSKLLTIE